MPQSVLRALVVLCASSAWGTCALAQQGAPQVPTAPQAVPPHLPPQFQLNPLEQAYLDQVLDAWERESGKISLFQCPFERWEYNATFGPGPDQPLSKEKGELSYQKPDKGSFQITEIAKWQATPVPPGGAPPAQAQGEYVVQPDAIGEHWVCDGKNVYEYRHDQKQLVVRPIPPQLQGQAIVDGPLPFLFGAEAAKLKARYWMRIEQQPNDKEIWIQALPRYQQQAADFRAVEVILDRQRLLPQAMQVHLPNGDRHVYLFKLAEATVNGHLQRIMALFQAPRTPLGWKRVVEEPQAPLPEPSQGLPTDRQAAQPDGATR